MNFLQILWSISIILFFSQQVYADEDFEWLPVTEQDWAVKEDAAKNIHNAIILFEKISTNDKELVDEECYYSLYRRIKILNNQGRSWADVTVPYLDSDQKVIEIMGRAILPDGLIININDSHIYEKEVLKIDDTEISQKSFYIPGVTDDCIIEYYIKFLLTGPVNFWEIEKDIYLKDAEFAWKFFRGQGLTNYQYNILQDLMSPNYLWLNNKVPIDVEQLPNLKDPEFVVFKIKEVEPFEYEPFTLPDIALKSNLRIYYSGNDVASAHWGDMSKELQKKLDRFSKENDEAKEIIKDFATISSKYKKIEAAYNWVQRNIEDISDKDNSESYDKNLTIDNVISNRYGTSIDINRTFIDMLREMNINAKLAYVVDRDKNLFISDAKYWQFHRSIVAVEINNKYSFYNPGGKYIQFGLLPWYNEGVQAFVIGDTKNLFYPTPFSSSNVNRIQRTLSIILDDDLNCSGEMLEVHRGQFAYTLRSKLRNENNSNRIYYLKKKIKELNPCCTADSLELSGFEDHNVPLKLTCNIDIPKIGQRDENIAIIKPYLFISKLDYKFYSETRKHPILFEFAKEITETIHLNLPENWIVEAIPHDSLFFNNAGTIQLLFKELNNSKTISIQRLFKMNSPFYRKSDYQSVKELFQIFAFFKDNSIILRKHDTAL